ncbi:MAG TPA: hypothetical protein VNV42_00500 [Solirubrobacteraceae bacterium]|jgi:hypothetical protein|nr:hypothetical protein [Solirubrobacteraceae bacterium]
MLNAIRKQLNPATVMAFVALLFATTGGAFAVTDQGGGAGGPQATAAKSKTKAKSTGKPGPRGPAGPKGATGATGPAGPAGPKGETGVKGENGAAGANGTSGTDGESVVTATLQAGEEGCEEGGSKFTIGGKTTTACNGEKGEQGPAGTPGTTGFTKTLPEGETETGTWSVFQTDTPTGFHWSVPLSFSIPLKAGVTKIYVIKNCVGSSLSGAALVACENEVKADEAFCPGTTESPKAGAGDLCIYQGTTLLPKAEPEPGKTEQGGLPIMETQRPGGGPLEGGAGPAGTVLLVEYEGPSNATVLSAGTWAVTAP